MKVLQIFQNEGGLRIANELEGVSIVNGFRLARCSSHFVAYNFNLDKELNVTVEGGRYIFIPMDNIIKEKPDFNLSDALATNSCRQGFLKTRSQNMEGWGWSQ